MQVLIAAPGDVAVFANLLNLTSLNLYNCSNLTGKDILGISKEPDQSSLQS